MRTIERVSLQSKLLDQASIDHEILFASWHLDECFINHKATLKL